ncbi:hypothetical protein [Thalassotalea agarivorans]|uniref:Apple domain-containing protein n=1 Tax=Thalassotalea agarivorans TaxID=349064 RepID=A0A1I0ENP1_THASX|nr:hypothetical protein [Thalassotalea agarivorans]SET46907.1 hypothetical protein SAMN05660429_01872 [Thalassotalea agarivorans]
MFTSRSMYKSWKQISLVLLGCMLLAGCPQDGKDGVDGVDGVDGIDGIDGVDGINCWDTNENGANDPEEDANNDGNWNVADCRVSNAGEQHPDAQYNFQHFCEAFANLGEFPQGCPSDTHVTPTGTLTAMIPAEFDSTYATCSDLSIVVEDNLAYWSLDNGFIANSQVIQISENDKCRSMCESDPKCVASEWHLRAGVGAGDCQIYYHSDSLTQPYRRECGIDVPDAGLTAAEACILALGSDTVWHAQCP